MEAREPAVGVKAQPKDDEEEVDTGAAASATRVSDLPAEAGHMLRVVYQYQRAAGHHESLAERRRARDAAAAQARRVETLLLLHAAHASPDVQQAARGALMAYTRHVVHSRLSDEIAHLRTDRERVQATRRLLATCHTPDEGVRGVW